MACNCGNSSGLVNANSNCENCGFAPLAACIQAEMNLQCMEFSYAGAAPGDITSIEVTVNDALVGGTVMYGPTAHTAGSNQVDTSSANNGVFKFLKADTAAWVHGRTYWATVVLTASDGSEHSVMTKVCVIRPAKTAVV